MGISPGPSREQAAVVRWVDANEDGDLHGPMRFPFAFVLFPKKRQYPRTHGISALTLKEPGPAPSVEPRWPVALAILGVIGLLSLLPGRIRLFPGYVP